MGPKGTQRAIQAAERRRERETQRRLRELERQAKQQAKLSAIEQARLEVETYENRVEALRSVHKEQGEAWDWPGVAPGRCAGDYLGVGFSYNRSAEEQRITCAKNWLSRSLRARRFPSAG